MITINNLKKAFGETVACDIPEFTINKGDILGLVGNNGAGKTTLFRMLLDLLKTDEGYVALDGINPAESEEWKAWTGSYIDEGFLIDFLTPEEYLSVAHTDTQGGNRTRKVGRVTECAGLEIRYTLYRVSGV